MHTEWLCSQLVPMYLHTDEHCVSTPLDTTERATALCNSVEQIQRQSTTDLALQLNLAVRYVFRGMTWLFSNVLG